MSHAVELPEGSIVATHHDAYVKGAPNAKYPWRTTAYVRRTDDIGVENLLTNGAEVVRYGYETDGRPDVGQPLAREFDGYPMGRLVLPDSLWESS